MALSGLQSSLNCAFLTEEERKEIPSRGYVIANRTEDDSVGSGLLKRIDFSLSTLYQKCVGFVATPPPKLLSLSPLQADEDLDGASYHFHAASQYRDLSPVRWARRKSSSSESERNCYNVQTSQVTTERSPTKKNKKRIQKERRRVCEKRNPLLDRVKNTRLSFFKDRDSDEEEQEEDEEPEKLQFRSMCELNQHSLTRNEFRRSVCESDLKEIIEEEKTQAKRKRRSKSQSRLPHRKQQEDRSSFLGLRSSAGQKMATLSDDIIEETVGQQNRRWRKSREFVQDHQPPRRSSMDHVLEGSTSTEDATFKDGSQLTV